eukprot:2660971-Amphidinium_carterae.2
MLSKSNRGSSMTKTAFKVEKLSNGRMVEQSVVDQRTARTEVELAGVLGPYNPSQAAAKKREKNTSRKN